MKRLALDGILFCFKENGREISGCQFAPAVSSAKGVRGDLNDGLSAVSSFDCGGRANREAPIAPIRRNVSKSGLEDLWLEAHPFNSQPYRST